MVRIEDMRDVDAFPNALTSCCVLHCHNNYAPAITGGTLVLLMYWFWLSSSSHHVPDGLTVVRSEKPCYGEGAGIQGMSVNLHKTYPGRLGLLTSGMEMAIVRPSVHASPDMQCIGQN